MLKDLAYYLSLNYPIELVREEGIFVAAHPDLPGCIAQGETADEAIASLDDAREAWIEVGLADKQFIPEPLPEEFSGRLSMRMPTALHAAVAHQAQRQGASLNQFIIAALAGAVGFGKQDKPTSQETEVNELARLVEEIKETLNKMVAATTTDAPSVPQKVLDFMQHQNVRSSKATTGLTSNSLLDPSNRASHFTA